MKEKALENFKNGYSCSESIVKAAIDEGLCDENLFACATPFSGGMGSGCLCGAISGAQMVIGYLYGKNNKFNNPLQAREKAKLLVEKFKEKHNATCCRVLSKDFDFHSPDRRKHCENMVETVVSILEELK